jgi:hypothetical protein
MFNWQFDRKHAAHYQAPFLARCGEGVLVFYEGAPKNGKTQLDEHEETCRKCKYHEKKGTVPILTHNMNKYYYERYNINMDNMNLFRKTTISIDGFEGNEIKSISYVLSDLETIENDEPITQQQVVEDDDGVFGQYNVYENLGKITEDELEVLRKFEIQ